MQAYQIKRLSLCSDNTCEHAPKETNDECIVFHENGQRHNCFRLFNFLSQSPKIVQTASSVSPAEMAPVVQLNPPYDELPWYGESTA